MNWFYSTSGAQKGPVDISVLKLMIQRGEVSSTDLVWKDGMGDWLPVSRLSELAPNLASNKVSVVEPSVSDIPSMTSVSPQISSVHSFSQPTQASVGLSIASMVCGIVSLFCCCAWYLGIIIAIAAVVMGHIFLSNAKKNNSVNGKGMATTGLICGYIGLILSLFVAILILAFPQYAKDIQNKLEVYKKEMEQSQSQLEEKSTNYDPSDVSSGKTATERAIEAAKKVQDESAEETVDENY
jgi:Sec-independent protein translocase protein TatA